MRALTLFAALALPAASIAAPYPYTMNGDRFVDMMHRPEPLNSYDYMLRERRTRSPPKLPSCRRQKGRKTPRY
jgi:hypothetical protein